MCKTIPDNTSCFLKIAVPGPSLTLAGPSLTLAGPPVSQDISHIRKTSLTLAGRLSTLAGRLSRCAGVSHAHRTSITLAGPPVTLGGPSLHARSACQLGPCAAQAALCSAAGAGLLGGPGNFLASITAHPELASSHLGMSCCSTAVNHCLLFSSAKQRGSCLSGKYSKLDFLFQSSSAILSSFVRSRTFLVEEVSWSPPDHPTTRLRPP